jgi:hypothetical protein
MPSIQTVSVDNTRMSDSFVCSKWDMCKPVNVDYYWSSKQFIQGSSIMYLVQIRDTDDITVYLALVIHHYTI